MKKFAIMAVTFGVLAFTFVTLMPQSADAGWRRKAWRGAYWGPGVSVYAGPRWGYYRPCGYYGCYARGYPYAYYPYWRRRAWAGWY